MFPISRDPPEGGTDHRRRLARHRRPSFQFLGIPPKGELLVRVHKGDALRFRFQFLGIPPKGEQPLVVRVLNDRKCFQFLGIPPKGEHGSKNLYLRHCYMKFPISRDPPEGGTS